MTRLLAALILGAATLLILVGMSRRGVAGPVRFVEPYDEYEATGV